jgi:hypothetical protein
MRHLRIALASVLLAGASLAAQTPPKVAPCDTTSVLAHAAPTYGVGVATIKNTCGTFAAQISGAFKAHPEAQRWTGSQLVNWLLTGVAPFVDTPPAPIPAPAPAPAPAPSPPAPSGSYPNRPSTFTHSTELDFSQAVPSLPDDRDRPISGTDWSAIYFGGSWSSSAGVWTGHWAPGSYGGGVIGQGGGHGIGNVFTYGPNAAWVNVAGITRLYASLRVYFDFDSTQWHPISNKFVNIEGDHSLFLVQLNEGGNWRHAEELGSTGFPSFGVDFNRSAGDVHLAGQIDNRPVPTRQWVQLELLIDIPNHVFKVWQDGVLTTNANPTFASTKIRTFGVNAFRGGGGETLTTDLSYKYDHFFIAW